MPQPSALATGVLLREPDPDRPRSASHTQTVPALRGSTRKQGRSGHPLRDGSSVAGRRDISSRL